MLIIVKGRLNDSNNLAAVGLSPAAIKERNKNMPMRDRTGPRGLGPATGRGMGPCGGGQSFGQGYRQFGFGLGYGSGYGYRTRFTKNEEKDMLAEEKKELEAELEAVKERIGEIEK